MEVYAHVALTAPPHCPLHQVLLHVSDPATAARLAALEAAHNGTDDLRYLFIVSQVCWGQGPKSRPTCGTGEGAAAVVTAQHRLVRQPACSLRFTSTLSCARRDPTPHQHPYKCV